LRISRMRGYVLEPDLNVRPAKTLPDERRSRRGRCVSLPDSYEHFCLLHFSTQQSKYSSSRVGQRQDSPPRACSANKLPHIGIDVLVDYIQPAVIAASGDGEMRYS